jgi:DNA-binding CsgD family transcriptional regulator
MTNGAARVVPGLTPRQLEVLELLAGGHSMKEVASILDVTPRTIAFHKYKMMDQLNVATTAELVQFAVRHGVVSR